MLGRICKASRTAEPCIIPKERLTALLEAAESIFLEKGYHLATMNDIAKAAGMSKKTIYAVAGSKIDLFFSILADHQEKIILPTPEPHWSVADTLTAHLITLGRFVLDPVQIALTRLMLAEYTHSPDFGRHFMRSKLAKTKERLEETLIGIARAQGLSAADAKEFSAMLFGMALGEFHIGTLVGFRAPPSRAALEARVRRAVEIFLAGCGTGMAQPPVTDI